MLQVESLEEVPIDVLLDALNPENPLERIIYRKQVAQVTTNRLEFVKLSKNQQQFDFVKEKVVHSNPDVCFKSLKYSVTESSGQVIVTVTKHCQGPLDFWVNTVAGSAIENHDYTPVNK